MGSTLKDVPPLGGLRCRARLRFAAVPQVNERILITARYVDRRFRYVGR